MDEVRMAFGKWGGRPHWEYDALRLGEDAHGVWLGAPRDTPIRRPGAELRTGEHQVVLIPWTPTSRRSTLPVARRPATSTSTSDLAITSCEAVLRAVAESRAPFDGATARRWLDVLEGAMMA